MLLCTYSSVSRKDQDITMKPDIAERQLCLILRKGDNQTG